MTEQLAGLFILDPQTLDLVYGPDERRAIERHVRWVAPPQTRQSIEQNPALLRGVEVIFAGWGAPAFDDAFLTHAPDLRAIFAAHGPTDPEPARRRAIVLTNAHQANSIPVAEYTLAAIIFSLKHAWRLARQTADARKHPDRNNVVR